MTSWLGGDMWPYDPSTDVDQQAEATQMSGDATMVNLAASDKRSNSIRKSPAKSLLVLWFVLLAIYFLLTVVFRRYVI